MKTKVESVKPNILLFGPPGVGKSTVGMVFHDEFGMNFYDADNEMNSREKRKVSLGNWNDTDRKKLLVRIAKRINQMYRNSENGLVTSAALTKDWMRVFLDKKTSGFLQFVLVTTLISRLDLEEKVRLRHIEGHPISLEAFKKFSNQFEYPTSQNVIELKNPHSVGELNLLIEEIDRVLKIIKE